jgi:hypothetical protein
LESQEKFEKLGKLSRSEDEDIRRAPRHCERSEAIQPCAVNSGLLRRFAPRNDGTRARHCERSEAIQRVHYDARQAQKTRRERRVRTQ